MLQMGELTLLPDGTAFLSNGAQIGRALYLNTVAYSSICAIESTSHQEDINI